MSNPSLGRGEKRFLKFRLLLPLLNWFHPFLLPLTAQDLWLPPPPIASGIRASNLLVTIRWAIFCWRKIWPSLAKKSLFDLQDEMQRLACQMIVISCVSSRKAQENTWVENNLSTQIEEARSELEVEGRNCGLLSYKWNSWERDCEDLPSAFLQ